MNSPLKESLASKKLWFSLFAVFIAFIFAILSSSYLPTMKEMYSTFTGLLEMVTATYLTGNLANKFILGRNTPKAKKKPDAAKPELPTDNK